MYTSHCLVVLCWLALPWKMVVAGHTALSPSFIPRRFPSIATSLTGTCHTTTHTQPLPCGNFGLGCSSNSNKMGTAYKLWQGSSHGQAQGTRCGPIIGRRLKPMLQSITSRKPTGCTMLSLRTHMAWPHQHRIMSRVSVTVLHAMKAALTG
jgi:hypothetical protein